MGVDEIRGQSRRAAISVSGFLELLFHRKYIAEFGVIGRCIRRDLGGAGDQLSARFAHPEGDASAA